MHTSILIIGQGLCGTWLSYYLEKAGVSFLVMDQSQEQSASRVASGIINPVTGRRLVKTWLIDEVMPFAKDAYQNFTAGNIAAPPLLRTCNVLDFFSAPDVEVAFNKRLAEQADFLTTVDDMEQWRQKFNFDFGVGAIDPCYLIDSNALLQYWRIYLLQKEWLLESHYDEQKLLFENGGICYENITADCIIYCDGITLSSSQYFGRLPFAPNKGEALIAEIPDLAPTHIFKKGMSLVPWKDGQYWIGSSYQWKFEDALPSTAFRTQAENWLASFCKMPFKIVDHLASVRPATVERRPFVGFHPIHKQLGIFNGMGTKGVSLAPYFAQHFVKTIVQNSELMPEINVKRYTKVLSR